MNNIILHIILREYLIIVNSDDLPIGLETKILGTFTKSNPEYYSKVNMGFRPNPNKIPKKIRLYKRSVTITDLGKGELAYNSIKIERGCYASFTKLVEDYNKVSKVKGRPQISLKIQVLAVKAPVDIPDHPYILEEYQQDTWDTIETTKKVQGMISYPPGGGKTILGLTLFANLKQRTIVLVHTNDLVLQWKARIKSAFPDIIPGILNDKRVKTLKEGKEITIATVQTVISIEDKFKFFSKYGLVILDECHHASAPTFQEAIGEAPCLYRFGLSASQKRRDKKEFLMNALFGDWIVRLDYSDIKDRVVFPTIIPVIAPSTIEYTTLLRKAKIPNPETGKVEEIEVLDYVKAFGALAEDILRNTMLLELIEEFLENEKNIILTLSKRREQAKMLHEFISSSGVAAGLLLGGGTSKYIREKEEILNLTRDRKIRVLSGTSVADEGLDVITLNVLVLTSPTSFTETLKQRLGRVMRDDKSDEDGKEAFVLDVVDTSIPEFVDAWKAREAFYKKNGMHIDYSRAPELQPF